MSEFVARYTRLLEDREIEKISKLHTTLVKREIDGKIIKDNLIDIVGVTSQYLTRSIAEIDPQLFSYCKLMLKFIASTQNPSEAALEFLQYMEYVPDNDVRFFTLLEPLGVCIGRTLDKTDVIEWSVNTIKYYIENLPIPSEVDQDEVSCRIITVLEKIISVLEPLVDQVTEMNSKVEETCLFGDYLLNLLIVLCGEPFCYLDKDVVETARYQILLIKIMTFAVRLTEDVLCFVDVVSNHCRGISLDKPQDKSTEELTKLTEDYLRFMLFQLSDNMSQLAYANFYFHIITEEVFWKKVPQVYSPRYLFETCSYLFKVLLNGRQNILISNGLVFMEDIVKRICPCSVPSDVLRLKIHEELFLLLVQVMVYRDVCADRKKAVCVFQKYIETFDMEARYSLISHLYDISEHSGVLSLITGAFKASVIECLDSTPRNTCFLGKNLELMLTKICHLPRGRFSDPVEISDEVIAALNLLRFLLIRDKHGETGIWSMKDSIQSEYLKPLRQGIEQCRMHWRIKAKDLERQRESHSDKNDMQKVDMEVTLTVGNQQLPPMSIAEKIAFSCRVMNVLDIMESILIRVNECMGEYGVEQAGECVT